MEANKENKKITSQDQFKCLVEFMEKNLEIGRGAATAIDKEGFNLKWAEVTAQLNSLGTTKRDTKGWQKVWSDYKLKVKRKLAQNKRERSATGGGPAKLIALNSHEETVANILNYDHIQQSQAPVFGLGETFPVPDENNEITATQTNRAGSSRGISSTSTTAKTKINRDALLDKQTNLLTNIAENVEESARYLRKIYKLKEEKLNLYKAELKRKHEYRQKKEIHNYELLQCKKRKLELEKQRLNFEISGISD